jgi:hypothetical protein
MVSELDGCPDPRLDHRELIRRNAATRSASGVGLARIVAEAQRKPGSLGERSDGDDRGARAGRVTSNDAAMSGAISDAARSS